MVNITKQEMLKMIPHKTMVFAKNDGVGYTFMGIDEDGKYLLCGMPYSYEDYIIMNSFEVKK